MSVATHPSEAAARPYRTKVPGRATRRVRLRPAVLAGLAAGALVAALLVAFHSATVGTWFYDPDDALRLVMVRDWLAGQPWGDVWQHRLQPGGTQMHWSRVDDLPVAGVIVALRGWLGQDEAERVAMTLWPVALLPALFALVASASGRGPVRLALAMATLCCGALLDRFMPGRIDHHAVMTTLSVLACVTLLLRPSGSLGAVAGLATVLCLAVGFEDLPVLAVLGGLVALLWALGREEAYPLWYGLGLLVGAVAAEAVLVPDGARLATACDCLSGSWVAALAVAGGGMALSARRGHGLGLRGRLLCLSVVGACTLAALSVGGTRRCLAGPYPDLSATAKAYWLNGVGEMLDAFTASGGDWRFLAPSLCAIALVIALAWERDRTPTLRECCYLAAFSVAAIFGIRYIRSSGLPVALAAPVVARGVGRLLGVAGRPRLLGLGMACASLVPAWLLIAEVRDDGLPGGALDPHVTSCETKASWSDVAALPPGRAIAPVDVGPDLLAYTPHSVLSAGIHRAFVGLDEQYRFMQGSEAEALAVARRDHLDYVVWCDDVREISMADRWNPRGVAAGLARHRYPSWLRPVPGRALVRVARVDLAAADAAGLGNGQFPASIEPLPTTPGARAARIRKDLFPLAQTSMSLAAPVMAHP